MIEIVTVNNKDPMLIKVYLLNFPGLFLNTVLIESKMMAGLNKLLLFSPSFKTFFGGSHLNLLTLTNSKITDMIESPKLTP